MINKAGNLEAIRDWEKRFFYTKEEVGNFFIKLNSGLKAYDLTIKAEENKNVIIVENSVTDPQSYTITTLNNGEYRNIFFFHLGSTITLTPENETSVTYNLNSYKDTISLLE